MKARAERTGGIGLDDVRVHYRSAEPARLGALAFARGRDIHLGLGQEKHLPHEVWHVVQQQREQVRPTFQMGATAINDEPRLEREAGAFSSGTLGALGLRATPSQPIDVVQGYFELNGSSISDGMRAIILEDFAAGNFQLEDKPMTKAQIKENTADFEEIAASKDPVDYVEWLKSKKITRNLRYDVKETQKATDAQDGRKEASYAGIELTGSNQKGKYPKEDKYIHAPKPRKVSYKKNRSRQALHHISEVVKWYLKRLNSPTMEVQTRYDVDSTGALSLSMSANERTDSKKGDPQAAITDLNAVRIRNMLRQAARSTNPDPRSRKSALKIRAYLARSAKKNGPDEDPLDLARMQMIVEKFTTGKYARVGGKKHAEQNLGDKALGGSAATDTAGTLIRCAACAAALGYDDLGRQISKFAHHVTGMLFFSKATAEQWLDYFLRLRAAEAKIRQVSERDESESEAEDMDVSDDEKEV